MPPETPPDGLPPLLALCRRRPWFRSAFDAVALVDALIEAGADPNATGPSGESPLAAALHRRQVELVRHLVACGARPDREAPTTQLACAAALDDLATVRRLLDAGVDPDGFEGEGDEGRHKVSALGIAVAVDARGVVDALLDAGADPDRGVERPIDTAADHGHHELLLRLHRRGATQVEAALGRAFQQGDPVDLCRAALDDGADAGEVLSWALHNGALRCAGLAVERVERVPALNGTGWERTGLQSVASRDALKLLQALADRGLDLEAPVAGPLTLLDLAKRAHARAVQAWLEGQARGSR